MEQSDAVEKINEARAIMKRNIDNPMPLESIAQSLNVSYSWFRSTFKSYTGVSPLNINCIYVIFGQKSY